jgi:hypothetical protein
MPDMRPHHIKFLVDEVFKSPNGAGYVMDFSDRTFNEFFDGLHIDITQEEYKQNGNSKANRLRAFLKLSDSQTAVKALRELWEYREGVFGPHDQADEKVLATKSRFFEIVQGLETAEGVIRMDGIDRFSTGETLDELIKAIERDIQARKPQASLDRLHTYCMKLFGHLVEQLGGRITDADTLHGRAGMYIRALEARGTVQDTTIEIMRSFIAVFDKYNHTRNKWTFAHDNELSEKNEARLIFEGITAILRYLKNTEASRFIP